MPCRPNYNLHIKAGGSPKLCFTASNFRDEAREACNPQIQIGIPYKRCGFNGPRRPKGHTHTAGIILFSMDLMRRWAGLFLLVLLIVEKKHGEMLVNILQLVIVIDGLEQLVPVFVDH